MDRRYRCRIPFLGIGKADKIKIREEILSVIENHRINLSKIDDENTLLND